MKKIALRAVGMSASIDKCVILKNISADFQAGRWISIVGPNGAGKSTLLKALAGLLPVRGEVKLFEIALCALPPRERAQQLAWLAQDESGALDMRVQDVVMLGRLPHQGLLGGIRTQDATACELAMQQTQTAEFATRLLGTLSAGQQQRVRLARALATQAKVLLLDEPLANLDPPHQLDWLHAIRALVQSGVTVISVLHELPMALMADEMVIMRDGEVVCHGECKSAATHRSMEAVFDDRVRVKNVDAMWAVLPRLSARDALPLSSDPSR